MVMLTIVWLVLSVLAGVYAERKGRSGIGIFFLSLLLSPLVGLVAALTIRPNEKKVAASQGKKPCPRCAEYVQPDAKVCRFCQYQFPELTEPEQLRASGVTPGPACPKCGSVNTFMRNDYAKAGRWWKSATIRRNHCRKCGGAWQDGKSVLVETTNGGRLAAFAFLALTVLLLIVALAGHNPNEETKRGSPSAAVRPRQSPPAGRHQAPSNWRTDESTNPMDGVKTTVLTDDCGDHSIVIRFTGTRLEAYVTTPEMVEYDDTTVRVRFDEGKAIAQSWSRSEDYEAVFSPNPRWLLAKLQSSRKFYIEYHPYQKAPETLSCDVAGLVVPKASLDAYDRRREQERAAWQRKFDACMEEQKKSDLEKYGASLAKYATKTEENYCEAETQ